AIAEIQTRYPVDKTEVETLFAVPVAAAPALEDATDVHDPDDPHHTKRTEAPRDGETGESGETAAGLYMRSSESEHTRSGALPLALVGDGRGEGGSTVDDITWGTAPPPPLVEPENSPLLFRLALATAALLLLFVVARALWRPGAEPAATAPKFAAALHAPTPSPVPKPIVPKQVPAATPAELPRIADLTAKPETVRSPEAPKETPAVIEAEDAPIPAPAQVRKPRSRPAAVRASRELRQKPTRLAATNEMKRKASPASKRPAPAPSVALARLAPRPWEEGAQPPGLLKPGPGVEEPVPLSLPRFTYPSAARGTGVKADVLLALLVDERGKVIDARVREGAPPNLGFAETALAAAKRISFQPATRHEVPGKMWTEMILEFAE
ncbi:MAG TPA: TonB family protein, partial [Thermoanaerobaculia bacterium]|nr:TonB family protein [Thermoanaerobaculia bacterium]